MVAGDQPHTTVHAPVALTPSPFPKHEFDRAVDCMPLLNTLFDRIADDEAFLQATLEPAARHDPFTARLLALMHETDPQRRHSRTRVAVNRSDYMLDAPTGRLLQVEMNTIASSFGALGTKVAEMHAALGSSTVSRPTNTALYDVADAMATAASLVAGDQQPRVLFVVQPGERNVYDQQWLQMQLLTKHGVHSVRSSLEDIARAGRLDDHGALFIDDAPVHLVYLRAGYSPDDYPSEAAWSARRMLEASTAALCPDVAMQLAGAKKVQQVLAGIGVVERFLGEDEAANVRGLFAGLWGLDDAAIKADACANPDRYVLKPQREGGGNNVYGADIAAMLTSTPADALMAYILMERIRPAVRTSRMLRGGVETVCEAVSELGTFGVMVRHGREVVVNKAAGYLVRTKAAASDEGGVAAGFAVLDSVWFET